METKVIALDVYGTMLSTIGENSPKRKGLDEFLERCKNKGLILCTCSDAKIHNLKKDLLKSGVDLKYFDKYFEMPRQSEDFMREPKDFTQILEYYNLFSNKLLVIGDRKVRDIEPALKLGCNAILVPEYYGKEDNNFDINSIEVP